MTARQSKGLDAIRDTAVQAAPAIHVLILNDVPVPGSPRGKSRRSPDSPIAGFSPRSTRAGFG